MAAHDGTFDQALGALTLTGAGDSPAVGVLAVTLGALLLTGAGDSPAVGTETPGLLGVLTAHGQGSALGALPVDGIFHPRLLHPGRRLTY